MTGRCVTVGEYVSFAHRLLWDSAQRHLTIAVERPDDSWMLHLSAGLLSAASFEAYLNYLGEAILPIVWKDERSFFAREPYRGVNGKLKRIAEELQWPLPPKFGRPFASVIELQNLRDRLVHARPKRKSYRRIHKADGLAPVPATWLRVEAPEKRVREWIADLEKFGVALHEVVRQSQFRHVVFGSHPFLGALGFGTHKVESAG